MGSAFTLSGSYTTKPAGSLSAGCPSVECAISEVVQLERYHVDQIQLSGDTPVAVNFGGITNAAVIVVKVTGAKVRVRLTSADGSAQCVPVDDWFAVVCQTVPVTAIDVTRAAGGATTDVCVFLGEQP